MALEAGVILLSIDYAKDLANVDWFGKQDPYCIVRVGSQTFRTRTAKDGGVNPVWIEKFTIGLLHENDVIIDIKDEDVGRDDFIGSATFSLARARQTGHDHLEVPVFGAKSRKQHGFIAVTLRWTPHRAAGALPHPYPQPQWTAVQYAQPLPTYTAGAPPLPPPACQGGAGGGAPPMAIGYMPYSPYVGRSITYQ